MGILGVNPYGTPAPHESKVIRWGVGCGIGYVPSKVLNKQVAVNNAIDKNKAIQLFNLHGVRTARYTGTAPCVGRTFEHTQGQNFWLCWQHDQIYSAKQEGAQYFIEYIPIKQEYRVHVLGGQIAFVQRKYQSDRISTAFMGIQGFSNNWHKNIFTGAVSNDIKTTSINAVKALGLDFGGVDILVSINDDKAYVAEVNTGPALPTEEVRAPYIQFFKERFEL
jgi:glutathione synthase/RimK-type ligase-like ATP-grasp enzyme